MTVVHACINVCKLNEFIFDMLLNATCILGCRRYITSEELHQHEPKKISLNINGKYSFSSERRKKLFCFAS